MPAAVETRERCAQARCAHITIAVVCLSSISIICTGLRSAAAAPSQPASLLPTKHASGLRLRGGLGPIPGLFGGRDFPPAKPASGSEETAAHQRELADTEGLIMNDSKPSTMPTKVSGLETAAAAAATGAATVELGWFVLDDIDHTHFVCTIRTAS